MTTLSLASLVPTATHRLPEHDTAERGPSPGRDATLKSFSRLQVSPPSLEVVTKARPRASVPTLRQRLVEGQTTLVGALAATVPVAPSLAMSASALQPAPPTVLRAMTLLPAWAAPRASQVPAPVQVSVKSSPAPVASATTAACALQSHCAPDRVAMVVTPQWLESAPTATQVVGLKQSTALRTPPWPSPTSWVAWALQVQTSLAKLA